MIEALEILTTASLWAAVLRIATPLIFGALGALICERSGVLNLGIEGIMTLGAMIAWHMIEETEHKSVSFDVYQDAVGSYPKRIAGMVLMTGIFLAISEYQRLVLVTKDGQLFNWRSALKGLKFQFTKPGFMRLLVKHYLPYYSPNFHPWDHDNREFLNEMDDLLGDVDGYS